MRPRLGGQDRAKFLAWVTELVRRRYPLSTETRELGQVPAEAYKVALAMLEKAIHQK